MTRNRGSVNWRAMWLYFSGEPVSFLDFVSGRWIAVMWRRGQWPQHNGDGK